MLSGAISTSSVGLLDLEQIDDDVFVGQHPAADPVRTFGGQMVAQAFVAAGRTVGGDRPAARRQRPLHPRR